MKFLQYSASVLVVALVSSAAIGQSSTENYIKVDVPMVPVSSVSTLNTFSQTSKQSTVSYLDGLGRPVQNVLLEGAGNKLDVYQSFEQDAFGVLTKSYDPYTIYNANGEYDNTAGVNHADFYSNADRVALTDYAFAEVEREQSPLQRVLETSAQGESWEMGNGKTKRMEYGLNGANEVRRWDVDVSTPNCTSSSFYSANDLFKTTTYNEHNLPIISYTDKMGRLLKKEIWYEDTTYSTDEPPVMSISLLEYETYYVYNEQGQLSYVIPPKAVEEMETASNFNVNYLTNTLNEDLCYHYQYDSRGRVSEKKIPGSDNTYILYNDLDQVVMSQDGAQRTNGQWVYYKYDEYGRLAVVGIYSGSASYSSIKSSVQAITTPYETRDGTSFSTLMGYTNTVYPTSDIEILKVYYYDHYDYDLDGTDDATYNVPTESHFESSENERINGALTRTKIKVLDGATTPKFVCTEYFYDQRGSVIQVRRDLYPSGEVEYNTAYNFSGLPTHKKTEHTYLSNTVTIAKRFTYDRLNRLVNTYMGLDGGAEKLISNRQYNQRGELIEKNVYKTSYSISAGQNPDDLYLQSIDFAYNERGWLTHINNCDLSNNSQGYGAGFGAYDPGYIVERLGITIKYYQVHGNDALELSTEEKKVYVPDMTTYDPNGPYTEIYANTDNSHLLEKSDDEPTYLELEAINGQEMKLDFYNIHLADSITDSVILAVASSEIQSALNAKGVYSTSAIEAVEIAVHEYVLEGIRTQVYNDDSKDIWGMCIDYDKSHSGLNTSKQYNGNISSIQWKSKDNNIKKGYGYDYDKLDRLVEANYKAYSSSNGWNEEVDRYTVNNLSYDKNGNILTLNRYGLQNATTGTFGLVDELDYDYTGNQRKSVDDNVSTYYNDFDDGVSTSNEYAYDYSGNMTADDNKEIDVSYNHLNLVELVEFPNLTSPNTGHSLNYIYDANGTMLAKIDRDDTPPYASGVNESSVYYMEEILYDETGDLKYISFEEGRINQATNSSTYVFEFHIKDHLGNLRAVFSDLNNDGSIQISNNELIQELNYYPFGLEHRYASSSTPPAAEFEFRFGGMEIQEEHGLQWINYGARMFDSQLGTWQGKDRHSESYSSHSVYCYTFNNPVKFGDPTGMDPVPGAGGWSGSRNIHPILVPPLTGGGTLPYRMGSMMTDYWTNSLPTFQFSVGRAMNMLMSSTFGGSWSRGDGISYFGSDQEAYLAGLETAIATEGLAHTSYSNNGQDRKLAIHNPTGSYVQIAENGKIYVPYTDVLFRDYVAITSQSSSGEIVSEVGRYMGYAVTGIGATSGVFEANYGLTANQAVRYSDGVHSAKTLTRLHRVNNLRVARGLMRANVITGTIGTVASGAQIVSDYQEGGWDQVNGWDVSDFVVGAGGLATTGAVAIGLISNPVGWAIGIGVGVYFGARVIYDLSTDP